MELEQAIEILKENKRALEETFPIMPKCFIDKYKAITTILNHINPPKAKVDNMQGNLTVDEMIEVHKPTMTLKHEAMIKIKE